MARKILDVTGRTYAEIRAHLGTPDGSEIDMHGIALRALPIVEPGELVLTSLVSARTKRGMVEIAIEGIKTQVDITKAREIAAMLHGAIEAAISDELIMAFLTSKVGLDERAAGAALVDFRELRQGTRGTVFPQ
jgi:hypothetical protein